jgi:hypothetical protein
MCVYRQRWIVFSEDTELPTKWRVCRSYSKTVCLLWVSIEVPQDKVQVQELLREAEFYQLTDFCVLLRNSLTETPQESAVLGKRVTVIKTEGEKDLLVKSTVGPMVILEVSSSSFGEEKVLNL